MVFYVLEEKTAWADKTIMAYLLRTVLGHNGNLFFISFPLINQEHVFLIFFQRERLRELEEGRKEKGRKGKGREGKGREKKKGKEKKSERHPHPVLASSSSY